MSLRLEHPGAPKTAGREGAFQFSTPSLFSCRESGVRNVEVSLRKEAGTRPLLRAGAARLWGSGAANLLYAPGARGSSQGERDWAEAG